MMDETALAKRVTATIHVGKRDDEQAHANEDALHLELIQQFCPAWVKAEIDRLTDADFARWCA